MNHLETTQGLRASFLMTPSIGGMLSTLSDIARTLSFDEELLRPEIFLYTCGAAAREAMRIFFNL